MLGIQKLDDKICQLLNLHDLTQCAQVCKKWHTLVIPKVWGNLTWLPGANRNRKEAFRLLVIDDYLAEQQHQRPQNDRNAMERSTQAPSPPLSTLSKYGRWIRLLPNPRDLQATLSSYPAIEDQPTESELLQHLLKCSPDDVQVTYLEVAVRDSDPTREMTIDFMLPRVRHLHLRVLPRSLPDISKATNLLDRCSATLRKLDLYVDIPSRIRGTLELEEEPMEIEPKGWTSFKELTLLRWTDNQLWPWFYKRCGQVEKMEATNVHGNAQVLAQAMSTHMHQLTEITMGSIGCFGGSMMEDKVAVLLSGSTRGWKRVTMDFGAHAGRVALEALEKHFSTLEALKLDGCRNFCYDGMVHILRSCPNLQFFTCIHGSYKPEFDSHDTDPLDIKVFIDRDPDTGSLRPWKCEQTLKELKFNLTRSPKSTWGQVSPEPTWGQGSPGSTYAQSSPGSIYAQGSPEYIWSGPEWESQDGLYDRLARLTQLEVLQLRDHGYGDDDQPLEMSLERGLYKLSGLKRMRELCFNGFQTDIGVEEVQWMVENWPRLRVIDGLDVCGDNREAAEWLRENCPEIQVYALVSSSEHYTPTSPTYSE